jgi:hypothetical protein
MVPDDEDFDEDMPTLQQLFHLVVHHLPLNNVRDFEVSNRFSYDTYSVDDIEHVLSKISELHHARATYEPVRLLMAALLRTTDVPTTHAPTLKVLTL